MESELAQYEVRPGAVGAPENTAVYSNTASPQIPAASLPVNLLQVKQPPLAAAHEQVSSETAVFNPLVKTQHNNSTMAMTPSLPDSTPAALLGSESLAAQDQEIYDMPNHQYNIVIAGDREEDEDSDVCQSSPCDQDSSENSNSNMVLNSVMIQSQLNNNNTMTPSLPDSTPLVVSESLAAQNQDQIMSSYISPCDPDMPNQYNIIIAGDDDEEEDDVCQTLTSPATSAITDTQLQEMSAAAVAAGMGGPAPYRSYTVQFKLNALDWYYKNGENKNLTAKMFQVDRKRIRDWLLDEPNLRSDPTPERTKRKRSHCLPHYKEIETALYHYYIEQREKGLRPKNVELRAKSLEFAAEYGYGDAFKASVHWLCNWKRRNKIGFVTTEPSREESMEEQIGRLSQSLKVQGGEKATAEEVGNSDGLVEAHVDMDIHLARRAQESEEVS